MSIEFFFSIPEWHQRLRAGPLSSDIDGFAALLATEGYAQATARTKLRLVADLSLWLDRMGLPINALDEQQVESFLLAHEPSRKRRGDAATGRQLLDFLRRNGRIPAFCSAAIDANPFQEIEDRYERYLCSERSLCGASVSQYLPIVHAFLTDRFGTQPADLRTLAAPDANRFILRQAQGLSDSSARLVVTVLRGFLRHLHQRGDTLSDLAGAVLPVVRRRLAGVPKAITPEQVDLLLRGCDRGTVIGRRDYAILLLLARLGLRAGEVTVMTLDDLDWSAGTVTVSGKGRRREPLPLLEEVGAAVADYLRDGRPPCSTRRLFVRIDAPHRGFKTSAAVADVVRRALARARLDPTFKGSHLLRHSLATGMLRNGSSLEEIGQILRHRHPETTQIYATVDLEALRSVAPAWPGGVA